MTLVLCFALGARLGPWRYCYVESWLTAISNIVFNSIQGMVLNYHKGYTMIGLLAAIASHSSTKNGWRFSEAYNFTLLRLTISS